jgi:transposase
MTAHTSQTFHQQFHLFLGFDWAHDDHDVVAVDSTGRTVLDRAVPDTAEGWADLRQKLQDLAGPDLWHVAVVVETCNGPAVERLLDMGTAVYPISAKAAKAFRQCKNSSGSKSDRLDAWSFADALRTNGQQWKALVPDDPLTQELRLLCRDEVKLIEQRTALVLQLQEALHEYYPAALEAFDKWVCPSAWAFVAAFPTPRHLVAAGRRKWEKFLHSHRLYREATYDRRLEIFARADRFCGPPAVTNAKSRLALALVKQLQVLEAQLREYRTAIETLFDQHPDRDIFGSLPGGGDKVAPRLLSEIGTVRGRFKDAQSLQTYAGSAPVTWESGKSRIVQFRRACNKHLRAATNFLADLSRDRCVWAQTYYQQKREQGKSHATALRCLAQRWLKILWKMWQTRTPYDEAFHLQNQTRHGSWVLVMK